MLVVSLAELLVWFGLPLKSVLRRNLIIFGSIDVNANLFAGLDLWTIGCNIAKGIELIG